MSARSIGGLPGYREAPHGAFEDAMRHYWGNTDVRDIPDGALWILYTKWLDVPGQTDTRTCHGARLRLDAMRYRDRLADKCRRRGIMAADA